MNVYINVHMISDLLLTAYALSTFIWLCTFDRTQFEIQKLQEC